MAPFRRKLQVPSEPQSRGWVLWNLSDGDPDLRNTENLRLAEVWATGPASLRIETRGGPWDNGRDVTSEEYMQLWNARRIVGMPALVDRLSGGGLVGQAIYPDGFGVSRDHLRLVFNRFAQGYLTLDPSTMVVLQQSGDIDVDDLRLEETATRTLSEIGRSHGLAPFHLGEAALEAAKIDMEIAGEYFGVKALEGSFAGPGRSDTDVAAHRKMSRSMPIRHPLRLVAQLDELAKVNSEGGLHEAAFAVELAVVRLKSRQGDEQAALLEAAVDEAAVSGAELKEANTALSLIERVAEGLPIDATSRSDSVGDGEKRRGPGRPAPPKRVYAVNCRHCAARIASTAPHCFGCGAEDFVPR